MTPSGYVSVAREIPFFGTKVIAPEGGPEVSDEKRRKVGLFVTAVSADPYNRPHSKLAIEPFLTNDVRCRGSCTIIHVQDPSLLALGSGAHAPTGHKRGDQNLYGVASARHYAG